MSDYKGSQIRRFSHSMCYNDGCVLEHGQIIEDIRI